MDKDMKRRSARRQSVLAMAIIQGGAARSEAVWQFDLEVVHTRIAPFAAVTTPFAAQLAQRHRGCGTLGR